MFWWGRYCSFTKLLCCTRYGHIRLKKKQQHEKYSIKSISWGSLCVVTVKINVESCTARGHSVESNLQAVRQILFCYLWSWVKISSSVIIFVNRWKGTTLQNWLTPVLPEDHFSYVRRGLQDEILLPHRDDFLMRVVLFIWYIIQLCHKLLLLIKSNYHNSGVASFYL